MSYAKKFYNRPEKPINPTKAMPFLPTDIQFIDKTSEVLFDLKKAKDALLNLIEVESFHSIFHPGEQGSIKILIDKVQERIDFLSLLQKPYSKEL